MLTRAKNFQCFRFFFWGAFPWVLKTSSFSCWGAYHDPGWCMVPMIICLHEHKLSSIQSRQGAIQGCMYLPL